MSEDEDDLTLHTLERELIHRLPWVESAQVHRTHAGLRARLVASTDLLDSLGCVPRFREPYRGGAIIVTATTAGVDVRHPATGELADSAALANWRDEFGERAVDVIAQVLSLSNYLINRADLELEAGAPPWSC